MFSKGRNGFIKIPPCVSYQHILQSREDEDRAPSLQGLEENNDDCRLQDSHHGRKGR